LLLGAALVFGVACDDDVAPAATTATATTEATAASTSTAATTETATAATTAAFPLTIADSSGVELTFEAPPERIVSYSPGATEILFAIGAGDLVVAADEFSDYPAETAGLPKVAYSTPDPEAALSLLRARHGDHGRPTGGSSPAVP